MSQIDVKDQLAKTMAARAQAKQEEAERQARKTAATNGEGFERYEVSYTALTTAPAKEGHKIVRFLGNLLESRQDPTDCRIVAHSWVAGKDGKKLPFYWPLTEDNMIDESFIMYRFMQTVTSGKWDKNIQARVFDHKDHPVFQSVKFNGDPTNAYEKGWYPGKSFVANVIDRSRMAWHKENKQTLVLSKNYKSSSDPSKSGFFDTGVPPMAYEKIVDEVVAYDKKRLWDEYDVVVFRSSVDPLWWAFHGDYDVRKLESDLTEAELGLISKTPLTEEEAGWQRWDLEKAFPASPLKWWKNHVGDMLKRWDADHRTTFYDELNDLVAREKVEDDRKAAMRKETTQSTSTSAAKAEPAPVQKEVQTEPATPQRSRGVAPAKAAGQEKKQWTFESLSDGSFNGTKYLGIVKLTKDEKALIIGVNDDGSFKYPAGTECCPWVDTNFMSPASFVIDPLTGEEMPPPEGYVEPNF